MSPERFTKMRAAIAEVNLWRAGMHEPKKGDIIERDGQQVRVTMVSRRPAKYGEFEQARPDLGDYILLLEYELPKDET